MTQPKKSKIEPVHIAETEKLKAIFDERAKLSQMKFGERFEIGSQGMVWQYLNARSPLNVESALKFARALECSVADFSLRLAQVLAGSEHPQEALPSPPTAAPPAPDISPDEQTLLAGYRSASSNLKEAMLRVAREALSAAHGHVPQGSSSRSGNRRDGQE